jgi:hypothetical protein
MKQPGQGETQDELDAEAAIAAVAAWTGRSVAYAPLPAGLASPSHRGVDSVRWQVTVEGEAAPWFLKVLTPEHAAFVDPDVAFAAAAAAAGAGSAPRPYFNLPGQRAIVTDLLGPDWSTATIDDLRAPDVLAAVISAKKAIHGGTTLGSAWTVFDRLRTFDAARRAAGVEGPADLWWMLDWAGRIEKAILAAGTDVRPGHADGLASNVMLGSNGAVMLVDFDEARDTDPFYELGALLNEAFQFEAEMEPALEMFEGRVSRASLARCRAYAAADDLTWGLWGLLMDKVSPRGGIEFLKYAQWRLLRCRMALRDPGFDAKLRQL